ncbi:MAG: hypothetical protein ACKOXG_13170 [Arenimonas sp.]
MARMRRALPLLIAAALGTASVASGQNSTPQMLKPNTTPTLIPVWNVHSGQIEALLVLEQAPADRAWIRPRGTRAPAVGNGTGKAVNPDGGLAIFCAGQNNAFNQLALLDTCQLGKKSTRYPAVNSADLETKAMLQRKSGGDLGLIGLSPKQRRLLATEFDTYAPSGGRATPPAKVSEGWVSINGNLSRAKLIPASQFPKGVPTEWDRDVLEIPARERSISGEVVGNVVTIPGQDSNLQSIGAGVSWKTPWKGKVSVGAESLLSQGRSSLDSTSVAPITDQRIDGVRPYVRVEIDL